MKKLSIMKNAKVMVIALFISILIIPNTVLAYDDSINQINDKIITNVYKNWIIRFNSAVNTNFSSESVQVRDLADGTIQSINLTLGDDDHSIKINAPSQGYKIDHNYEILVDNNIKSKTGKNLNRKALMNFKVMDFNQNNYSASANVITSPILPMLKQITINSTNLPQIKKFKVDGNNRVFGLDEQGVSVNNTSTTTIYFYGNDGATVIGKGTLDVSGTKNNLNIKIINAD